MVDKDVNSTDAKDLTGFLLTHVRQRPGMYLGKPHLSMLVSFVTGYMICSGLHGIEDRYFGEHGFIEWYFKKRNIHFSSTWHTPFLEEANDNEEEALKLFFDYLEEFSRPVPPFGVG